MCGIAGILGAFPNDRFASIVNKMSNALHHRGPDDGGVWLDQEDGIGLAHRRLSVIDLSSAGHQPMQSASGRYVIVFNGEIYNHLELRRELAVGSLWVGEGIRIRRHCLPVLNPGALKRR